MPHNLVQVAVGSIGTMTPGNWRALLWILVLLLGAAKCVRISRRPTTNTYAVWSLALTLGSIATVQLLTILRAPLLYLTLMPLALAGAVAGLVLGIVGLIQIRRRSEAYLQGTSQACWSVALGGLIVSLVIVGAVGLDRGRGGGSRGAGVPATFDELNFRFTPPDGSWAKLGDASRINPDAVLTYHHVAPAMSFTVIAEAYPDIGRDLSSTALAEIAAAHLRSAFEEVTVVQQEGFEVNGLDGTLMVSRTRLGGQERWVSHWLHSRDDFLYQLVLATSAANLEVAELRRTAQEVLSGFEIIDPAAGYQGFTSELVGSYRSVRYPFALELAGTEWRHWTDVTRDIPGAVVGGRYGLSGWFAVVAVELGDLEPAVEALADGLLPRIGLDFETVEVTAVDYPIEEGGKGLRLAFSQGEMEYRALVLRSAGAGYLVAAWGESGGPAAEAAGRLVERFRPLPEPADGPRSSEDLGPDSAIVLNDIGCRYYADGQYAESARYFSYSFELNPKDPQVLENLVESLTRTGSFEEARRVFASNEELARATLSLWSYLPFVMVRTGEMEQAADEYRELFAAGHQDDYDLELYAELLLDLNRDSEALQQVAAYRVDRDSAGTAKLAASLHSRQGDFAQSIELLRAALQQRPFNRDLRVSLVEAYHGAARHREAVDTADSFLETGSDRVDLLLLKGRSEMALGRYQRARRSFEAAREAAHSGDLRAQQYLDSLHELAASGGLTRQTGP